MKFIDILEQLKADYKDDCLTRKNGTLLLAPGKIPNCKHMIFKGLQQEYIDYLVASYAQPFPKQYIELLRYANGANLLWVKRKTIIDGEVAFEYAGVLLNIFGLPLRPPFPYLPEMEEPFDVRIEDLSRHQDIPKHWLKCGCFNRNYTDPNLTDIFIDTKTERVYSCYKNENEIFDEWNSLDESLCDLWDKFKDHDDEYCHYPSDKIIEDYRKLKSRKKSRKK